MKKIDWEEALKIINDWEFRAKTEKVFLCEAEGRIIAENIITDIDFPNVSIAKIEGYACRRRDLNNKIEIIDITSIESEVSQKLSPNKCVYVYPGDILPNGVDICIPVEKIEKCGIEKIILVSSLEDSGLISKGADKSAGEIVLPIGVEIGPRELGLLAATGNHEPGVYFKPKVGVYSFGKNLIEPMFMPFGRKERNSSGTLLTWLAKKCGVSAEYSGILKNDSEAKSEIMESLIDNDLIIIGGLNSKDDKGDLISILQELDFKIKFVEVDINPGGDIIFATMNSKSIICLFGTGIASANAFELVVKPVLYRLKGGGYKTKFINMILANDFIFEKPITSNLTFIPGKIDESGNVVPIDYSGVDGAYLLSKTELMFEINGLKANYKAGDIIKAFIY